MSKFLDQPQSSETTGPISLGSAVASCLGQAHGGTIAERSLIESNALAQLRPADTDRRVADALQHISGRLPVFRRRTMFPENGPTYSITETASWKCDDADQQQRGLVAVNFSLRPAPEARIAQALYELRTLTRGRVNREASEDEAEALIWTQHLRQYPADIVLHTLKNWPARSDGQWWPTWHDIHKIVEAETVARRMLAEHIRAGKCLPAPKVEQEERDDSPEGIAHRQAVVERNMRKLPKDDPVHHVEDFDEWNAQRADQIAAENKAGRFQLSAAALEILDRKPRLSDEDFKKFVGEREEKTATSDTQNKGGRAA